MMHLCSSRNSESSWRHSSALALAILVALVAGAIAAMGTRGFAQAQQTAPAQTQGPLSIVITGQKKLRMAVPDFAVSTGDTAAPPLEKTFHEVLWNDLEQSGLVEMVSRSYYPLEVPGTPADLPAAKMSGWANPPASSQRLAFGNLRAAGNVLQVEGYLYDVTNTATPFMLGKRYNDQATDQAARLIAHEFATAIIEKLGGGPGVALSKIAFVSNRTGNKEIWLMDYDGANQQQLSHLGSIAYSPRISPDGSKVAFQSYADGTPQIRILSLITHHYLPFPHFKAGLNATPAWSPDGRKLAFASSMSGDVEIYTINADGTGLHRLTYARGVDIAPIWNPKTGNQIAFESDRTGMPQIYIMDADGTNQQRLTTGGYAVSPSWSPNGEVLAFSWRRTGGGENTGTYDIYLMNISTRDFLQLTHNNERNDFPSWAPDGRHVVFQSGAPMHTQLFTILADGSNAAQLTNTAGNERPDWSTEPAQ